MKKLLLILTIACPAHTLLAMDEKPTTEPGKIILFTGAMASGKSRRTIEILASQGSEKIIAFQHACVASIKPDGLSTRSNATTIPAIHVGDPRDMETIIKQKEYAEVTHVGIDEAQFFPESMCTTLEAMQKSGKTIIIAALENDFRNQPFPTTQAIKKIPGTVVIPCTDGICYQCQTSGAQCTVRLHGETPADLDEPIVKVGDLKVEGAVDDTHYQPCCSDCYKKLYPDRTR